MNVSIDSGSHYYDVEGSYYSTVLALQTSLLCRLLGDPSRTTSLSIGIGSKKSPKLYSKKQDKHS